MSPADDTWQNVSDAFCETSATKAAWYVIGVISLTRAMSRLHERAEAKLSHIILPEIAGQLPSDQSPENDAAARTLQDLAGLAA